MLAMHIQLGQFLSLTGALKRSRHYTSIHHFTVVCSVTWPLNGSEAGGDLVLIQTSLLLLCKSSGYNAHQLLLHDKTEKQRPVSKQS